MGGMSLYLIHALMQQLSKFSVLILSQHTPQLQQGINARHHHIFFDGSNGFDLLFNRLTVWLILPEQCRKIDFRHSDIRGFFDDHFIVIKSKPAKGLFLFIGQH